METMPLDVVELVLAYCLPSDFIALSMTCTSLRDLLRDNETCYRRLCKHWQIAGWKQGDTSSWKDVYQVYVHFRRRIRTDPKIKFHTVRKFQHVTDVVSHRYRTEFHPGDDDSLEAGAAPSIQSGAAPEAGLDNFVRLHTFAYTFDDDKFVLSRSPESEVPFSYMSAFKHPEPREFVKDKRKDFYLPYQHVHMWQGYLVCIPYESATYSNCLLTVFDVDNDFKLVGKLEHSQGYVRRTSPVYCKEDGPNRIYSWNEYIVFVDVVDWIWYVRICKAVVVAQNVAGKNETEVQLTELCALSAQKYEGRLPLEFSASDQRGDKLAFCFSCSPLYVTTLTTFVTVDLGKHRIFRMSRGSECVDQGAGAGKVDIPERPVLMCLTYRSVVKDADFFPATENALISSANSEFQLSRTVHPELVTLDRLSGRSSVCVLGASNSSRFHLPSESSHLGPPHWPENQMVVVDETIIISHLMIEGRILFALDLDTLALRWRAPMNAADRPDVDRLLYSAFDLLWLADSETIRFLSPRSGRRVGYLAFPRFRRLTNEMVWESADFSPYAESRFCVWEIALGKRKPQITIVHDMERCLPLCCTTFNIQS